MNKSFLRILFIFCALIHSVYGFSQKTIMSGGIVDYYKDKLIESYTISLIKDNIVLSKVKIKNSFFYLELDPNQSYGIEIEYKNYSHSPIRIKTNFPESFSSDTTIAYDFMIYVYKEKNSDRMPDNFTAMISFDKAQKKFRNNDPKEFAIRYLRNGVGEIENENDIGNIDQMINQYTALTKNFFEKNLSDSSLAEFYKVIYEEDSKSDENQSISEKDGFPFSTSHTNKGLEPPEAPAAMAIWNKVQLIKDSISNLTKMYRIETQRKTYTGSPESKKKKKIVDSIIVSKIDSIINDTQKVIVRVTGDKDDIKNVYNTARQILKRKEDIQLAKELLKNTKQSVESKEDSLMVALKELELNEAETQVLLAEKQLENAHKQIDLQQERIKRQKSVIVFSMGCLLLVIVFLVIVLRQFKAKRKAYDQLDEQNKKVMLQKAEIEAQRDEIESQRDEIEAQRDTVIHQKEQLETIHEELKDSIHYAKRIQNAILPVVSVSDTIIADHFIIFKPRDIVSGDFYYLGKVNKWLLACVADCTGHGVPGAFMSMMGMAFLTELVNRKEIIQSNHLLNELRNKIISALNQKGVSGEQKDGMDLAFCAIDTETNECQYAGANNALYFIKKNGGRFNMPGEYNFTESDTHTLYEIKADKMPVSIYYKMDDFNNHVFKIEKGDQIYMFSDGYPDQIGGPKGKKYKYAGFRKMLLDNAEKTCEDQKKLLEQEYSYWVNCPNPHTGRPFEQIDDIVIMGIKF